ncbi:MAG TPA: hypothetical protein VMV10_21795 [Pirellulales bacterium]|nr:hypothetical protein [Pirellulales bacterium]
MASAPMASAPLGGAPEGNRNNLRHGLRADPTKQYVRLTLGALPRSLGRVERDAYEYRASLEAAVVTAHGEISLSMAHAVDTATRWFRHGQAALAWLRQHEAEMSHDQRLSYSREIARAAAERDKAIERLRLDRDKTAIDWSAFYARPMPQIGEQQ